MWAHSFVCTHVCVSVCVGDVFILRGLESVVLQGGREIMTRYLIQDAPLIGKEKITENLKASRYPENW